MAHPVFCLLGKNRINPFQKDDIICFWILLFRNARRHLRARKTSIQSITSQFADHALESMRMNDHNYKNSQIFKNTKQISESFLFCLVSNLKLDSRQIQQPGIHHVNLYWYSIVIIGYLTWITPHIKTCILLCQQNTNIYSWPVFS